MPVLPKWPSVLMHFDGPIVDNYNDVAPNYTISTTPPSQITTMKKSQLNNKTFNLDSFSLKFKNETDFDNSGSFTVSWWENLTSAPQGSVSLTLSAPSSPNYCALAFGYVSGTNRYLYSSSTGAGWELISGFDLGIPIYYQWVHWEAGYDSVNKKMYIFKNGTLLRSFTFAANPVSGADKYTYIGQYGNYIKGAIADFDFSAGVCKHTADFTPNQPTSTQVNMYLDTRLVTNGKFGSSIYLAGYINMYPSLLGSTDKDFTISFWEYLINAQIYSGSLTINSDGSGNDGSCAIILGYNIGGNKTLCLSADNSGTWDIAKRVILEPITNLLNRWAHWEVCYKKSSKMFYVFLDGVLKHAVVCPSPLKQSFINNYLGWGYGGYYQTAYYDEFLVLPGVCLHTDEFTPPTEPYSLPSDTIYGNAITLEKQGSTTPSDYPGKDFYLLDKGQKSAVNSPGIDLEMVSGNRNIINYPGKTIDLVYCGISAFPNFDGKSMLLNSGIYSIANYPGKLINNLYHDDNIAYKFDLLVTPTHLYKNQFSKITNTYKYDTGGMFGKYQLKIGDAVVVPYGGSYTDIQLVEIDVLPSKLAKGKNYCKLEFEYSSGKKGFIDFEITKEENFRNKVERTFKNYDGGYLGDKLLGKVAHSVGQTFMVPKDKNSTIIFTSPQTNVPLAGYENIKGVLIKAEGAKVLVSMDGKQTWKAWAPTVLDTNNLVDAVPKFTATSDFQYANSGGVILGESRATPSLYYQAYRMFNDTVELYGWTSSNSAQPDHKFYVMFPVQKTIVGLTLTQRGSTTATYMPSAWVLEGSNDDGGTWYPVDTRTNQTSWTIGQKVTYLFANNKSYKTYRFRVTNAPYIQVIIEEAELLEAPVLQEGWKTVSLDDIATQGMEVSKVNSITQVQWADLFTPTSLDFAIYLENNLSSYVPYIAQSLLYEPNLYGGNIGDYTVPSGYAISKLFANIGAAGASSAGTLCVEYTGDSDLNPPVLDQMHYKASNTNSPFTEDFGEVAARYRRAYMFRASGLSGYIGTMQVYGGPKMAYLKSIDIDITPLLKRGYAFIM
ncbi:hypothetical protein SRRS_07320 [Sporomusa rhizae]|uniref:hypothetical protein n=1 Tax=Sporomusa rhizae TaxID=357999 RepID=UPI003529EA07